MKIKKASKLYTLRSGVALCALCTLFTGHALASETRHATSSPDQNTDPLPPSDPPIDQTVSLEEIIVTAQRRQESLQEVPITVTAVTAQALANSGIDISRELPQVVPSVQFNRSGASGLFFVRGVGTSSGAAGEEGANAFYVDGVYLADLAQTVNNFNNIARIEVLAGPQGTLFGRNATGGLVHIITKDPASERYIQGELGYGSYDTVSAKIYAAAPLTDTLSADLAFTASEQGEGWGRNLTLDQDNAAQKFWGLRSKAIYTPSDRIKVKLAGDYYENTDNISLGYKIDPGTVGTGGFTGPSGHDTTLNDAPYTRQKIWGVAATAEFDLGFAALTSITSHRKSRNNSGLDVDGGPLPIVSFAFVSGVESGQQELRLASNTEGPLTWQVGAFYLHSKGQNDASFKGSAFGSLQRQAVQAELTTDSYALFGEATYSLPTRTKFTAGLRFTEDNRHYVGSLFNVLANGTAVPGGNVTIPSGKPLSAPGIQNTELSYDAVTWRLAVRQDLTDDVNVYASVNRGFKAGSYSLQSPLNDPYLPQYITAYEVGFKSEFFDRRLRLNVSAYHYDLEDYQVRSAATTNPGAALILNAATVQVDGVDLQFEAAPTDALRLFGGFTYLDSRFEKFGGPGAAQQAPITYPIYVPGQTAANSCLPAALGSTNPGLITGTRTIGGYVTCFGEVSGNRTPNAPELTASLGASYILPVGEQGQIRFSGLYSYNSGYFFDPDNRIEQENYSLLNASIELRPRDNLALEFWGRNLTDEEYAASKATTGTGVTSSIGAPRLYGFTLKFEY